MRRHTGRVERVVAACCLVACSLVAAAAAAPSAPAPVVVLDPGHDLRANLATEPVGPGARERKIKDGGGTRGRSSGVTEAALVLDVSLRLARLLRSAGVDVVLTRRTTAGAGHGNVARARIANRARAALFLRIHADGSPDPAVRGTHTLVPAYRAGWTDDIHAASRRAARAVQPSVVRALGLPDRGISERADFTGFNWSDVPVVLVELGFLTNRADERVLVWGPGRRRAAAGLCRGALAFLGVPARTCGR